MESNPRDRIDTTLTASVKYLLLETSCLPSDGIDHTSPDGNDGTITNDTPPDPHAITNLQGIGLFANLTDLSLPAKSSITDLSPLSALTSLQHLNLSGSLVRDLAPLRGLPITSLRLPTTVDDLSDAAALPHLNNLVVNNPHANITVFDGFIPRQLPFTTEADSNGTTLIIEVPAGTDPQAIAAISHGNVMVRTFPA